MFRKETESAMPKTLTQRSLERLQDAAGDIADDVRAKARAHLHKAKTAAKAKQGLAMQRARAMQDALKGRRRRDNALLTLGVGVAVGLVVGMVFRGPSVAEAALKSPPPAI